MEYIYSLKGAPLAPQALRGGEEVFKLLKEFHKLLYLLEELEERKKLLSERQYIYYRM